MAQSALELALTAMQQRVATDRAYSALDLFNWRREWCCVQQSLRRNRTRQAKDLHVDKALRVQGFNQHRI